MSPLENFNSFCQKFTQVRELNSQGKLQTKEAQKLLMEMVVHHWEFDTRMEKYVSKWKFELVNIGFYIKLHCPEWPDEQPVPGKIDVSDIEIMAGSDEYNRDYLIFRKDIAHKDRKVVTVANYCKDSTPWSLLGDDYQEELLKKTVENITNYELGLRDPETARKKSHRRMRKTPPKWTLPDNERDW